MINLKEIENSQKIIFSNILNKKSKKTKNHIKFNSKLPLIPFNNIRIPKTNRNILNEEEYKNINLKIPKKINSSKKIKINFETNKQNNEILIENFNQTQLNNFNYSQIINPNFNLNFDQKNYDKKSSNIFLKTNTILHHKNYSNLNNNIKFINYYQSFCGSNLINNNYIKKINQDKILVLKNILKINNFSIFSVFDGHGPDGHLISNLCSEIIEKTFTDSTNFYIPRNSNNFDHLNSLKNYINSNDIYHKLKCNNFSFIKNTIKNLQNSIENSENDFLFSGTTLCQLILFENKLISINIGDSKAILIKNQNEIINLTTEHKPNIFSEKIRIEQNGGEIKRLNSQTPFRVYVKGQSYPGIAMSRSLGDKISKKIGVCNEPEIKEFEIDENCKGIVLASDGVWEFVQNEIVCEMFFEFYTLQNGEKLFVDKLYNFAKKQFLKREISVDDISIVVVFFGKKILF